MSISVPDERFTYWSPDTLLAEIAIEKPLLACWESKTHPAQIRMQSYLDSISQQLTQFDDLESGLCLEYEIDVERQDRMIRHHDLENYLTPIAQRLGGRRFCLARARKFVGGGSRLRISTCRIEQQSSDLNWPSLSATISGGIDSKAWKSSLVDVANTRVSEPLGPGPVHLEIAWRTDPALNWTRLWKPTGDGLGPLLGYSRVGASFHPQDDRITSIGFHLTHDPKMSRTVDLRVAWKLVEPDESLIEVE